MRIGPRCVPIASRISAVGTDSQGVPGAVTFSISPCTTSSSTVSALLPAKPAISRTSTSQWSGRSGCGSTTAGDQRAKFREQVRV